MSIATVLFDLDETLMPDDSIVQAAMEAACRPAGQAAGLEPAALAATVFAEARRSWRACPFYERGVALGIASWEALWATFEGPGTLLAGMQAWAPDFRREVWSAALAEHGVTDGKLVDRLSEAFIAERRARCEVYPDALPVLEALSARYMLGLVTNGPPDLQRFKLQSGDLERFFPVVAISGEIGYGKPDARFLNFALNALNANPATTVIVGDSLPRDVQGARNAGLHAVWLNRQGQPPSAEHPTPDREISTLSELPAVLETL